MIQLFNSWYGSQAFNFFRLFIKKEQLLIARNSSLFKQFHKSSKVFYILAQIYSIIMIIVQKRASFLLFLFLFLIPLFFIALTFLLCCLKGLKCLLFSVNAFVLLTLYIPHYSIDICVQKMNRGPKLLQQWKSQLSDMLFLRRFRLFFRMLNFV